MVQQGLYLNLYPEKTIRTHMRSNILLLNLDVSKEAFFSAVPRYCHDLVHLHSAGQIHVSGKASPGRVRSDLFPFLFRISNQFPSSGIIPGDLLIDTNPFNDAFDGSVEILDR